MLAQLCNAHLGRKKRVVRPSPQEQDLHWQQAEQVRVPLTPPPLPPRTNNVHGNRSCNLRTVHNPPEPDDADHFLRYDENPAYGLISAPGHQVCWDDLAAVALPLKPPPSPAPPKVDVRATRALPETPVSLNPEKEKEKSAPEERRKNCCAKCAALKRAKRVSDRREEDWGKHKVSEYKDSSTSKSKSRFGYNVNDVVRFLGNSTLHAPANLPVVIDDGCWLHQGSQPVERRAWVPMGMVVNALFCHRERVFVRTPCGGEGFVPISCCIPLGILTAAGPTKDAVRTVTEDDRHLAWMTAKMKTLGLEDCGKKVEGKVSGKVAVGVVANKTDNQKLCEFNPACRKKPRCLPYCHCRLPSWKDGLLAI